TPRSPANSMWLMEGVIRTLEDPGDISSPETSSSLTASFWQVDTVQRSSDKASGSLGESPLSLRAQLGAQHMMGE
ncbi:hypothetical protein P7K49_040833, partial [Saguinus oedipus]